MDRIEDELSIFFHRQVWSGLAKVPHSSKELLAVVVLIENGPRVPCLIYGWSY